MKIIRNEHNRLEMLKLADSGRAHRNKIDLKRVKPNPEFYKIFSEEQIVEIINNLKLKRNIPLKFTYLGDGARMWDEFIVKAKKEGIYSTIDNDQLLLKKISPLIFERVKEYSKINIIDIGTGNSEPIRETIEFFQKTGKLNKFVAVDISQNMLEISEKRLKDLKIKYKGYLADIENNNILKILFENKDSETINLVFFIGGTIGNFEDEIGSLKNFSESLDNEDVFIITNKIEKENIKLKILITDSLSEIETWIPKMIGLNPQDCEVINTYKEAKKIRTTSFILESDYEITFDVSGREVLVKLFSGEQIQLWFHHMSTIPELMGSLKGAGFDPLEMTTTNTSSRVVVVAKRSLE